jgi:Stage II sporulation protein E (SpoIIE)
MRAAVRCLGGCVWLCVAVIACGSASAQRLDATKGGTHVILPSAENVDAMVVEGLGTGTVELGGKWEFKTGDDMAWASPGFDDSAWEKIGVDRTWGVQTHFAYTGFAWYRRHIDFVPTPATGTPDLALFVPTIHSAYEVYWNGRLVGGDGKLPPQPVWLIVPMPHTLGLGAAQSGVLAIRVWKAPTYYYDSGTSGGLAGPPIAGTAATIAAYKSAADYRFLRSQQYACVLEVVVALVALLGLVAWRNNRDRRALLWMAVYLSASGLLFCYHIRLPLTFRIFYALVGILYAIQDIALWFLLLNLLDLDRHRVIARLTRIFAAVSLAESFLDASLQLFDWSAGHHNNLFFALDGLCTVPQVFLEAFPLVLLGFALRGRLSFANRLLAISASLATLVKEANNFVGQGVRYTRWTIASKFNQPLFTWHGNAFQAGTVADTLLLISIVYAVYRYAVEQSDRQRELEQEFRSAQEVQRVLIPETLPPLPGYAVTSAYRPAREVGGDFFQIIPQANGATLLVLGDVSGKGLKAAMSVALIVGAVRTLAAMLSDPAEILAGLNERLYGRMQNGFATCVVLRLEPDGECAIANAGHLSPFLNDGEVELPGALPLGIAQDVAFETTMVMLDVDDCLTLYTDGLLEARDQHSGELYGFDRVRDLIATHPDAHAASEAAVAFGQDDDITVLTVMRLAVGVESTTLLMAPKLAPAAA